jgi:hypothetical protein
MYGGQGGGPVVLGAGTGGIAVAALPNTAGSRSVLANVAILSIAIGVAVLVTTTVRFVAKRHYSA